MNADSTAEVVIPLSKGKLVLLILACIAFVAGGIWIWSKADSQTRYNPLYMKGVAIACLSFFGICGIYGCIKVFDSSPGLIIDNQGIVDNSSAVSAGRVPWDEIIALRISEIAGQRFLTIEVTEPEKYIERCGVLLRMLNSANTKMMGSPINISSNSLKVNVDELVRLLTEAFDKHRADGRTIP
jgi:hypothetical protein